MFSISSDNQEVDFHGSKKYTFCPFTCEVVQMTNLEKHKIMTLREKGYGYIKIANELRMSSNTVKSFCRRNSILRPKADDKHYCKCCGKEVAQNKGRKEKKFCSDKCRMKWWNSNMDKVDRRAYHQRTCLNCGNEFTVYGAVSKKYCSHACYIRFRCGGGCHEAG